MPKDPRPENTPWMMPYLTVRDADIAIAFYEKAFGFTKKLAMPDENGKTFHAEMTYHDVVLMFGPENQPFSDAKSPATSGVASPVSLFFYVEDVDAACARAEAAGATVKQPPTDMFWGDRMGKLIDPDGHIWALATYKGEAHAS